MGLTAASHMASMPTASAAEVAAARQVAVASVANNAVAAASAVMQVAAYTVMERMAVCRGSPVVGSIRWW